MQWQGRWLGKIKRDDEKTADEGEKDKPGSSGRIQPPAPGENASAAPVDPSSSTRYVRRSIKPGERINHPGTVVVFGDVMKGAVVEAGKDVIIWGRYTAGCLLEFWGEAPKQGDSDTS